MGSPWDWDLLSALVHAIIPLRSDWYVNHTSSKAKDMLLTDPGNAVDRYGARTIALLGFVFDFPVFVLLSLITTNTTQDQVLLYIFLFFAGLASVLQMVALMADVHHIVSSLEMQHPGVFGPQGGTAQAYGLYNGAWSCGQMLGPLVAGFLVDQHGWSTMVTAFGVMSAVVAVVYVGVYGRKGLKGVW